MDILNLKSKVNKELKQVRTRTRRIRQKNRTPLKPYEGNNQFISDTARAWGLSYKETQELFSWVGSRTAPWYRSTVLTKLLRRKYKALPNHTEC